MIENTSSSDPQWKTVREDGSVFPASEHPAMIALREGKRVRNVVMGLQHLNEEVWISINAEPLFGADGAVTHVIASFAEITEQINTSRRLNLLSKVFTHARITSYNVCYTKLLRKQFSSSSLSYRSDPFFDS